jgi:hypothetical protein
MVERKHLVQARLVGIKINGCSFDAMGKRILDIGGGPVSVLLKTQNLAFGMLCNPITYPAWVYERYRAKGIIYLVQSGDHVISFGWDEVDLQRAATFYGTEEGHRQRQKSGAIATDI